jgi:hypothetical protein
VLLLAAIALAGRFLVNLVTPYELHRDEFLYFAMGRHLDLWRMDFPPFIAVLAELVRGTIGDSPVALRLAPAIAGALLVVFAGLTARALGGASKAQGLAALSVLASPLVLRTGSLFQPVIFDQLWWTVAFYALLRIGQGGGMSHWVLLGLAGGIGLLTKFVVVVLGAATGLALMLVRRSALAGAGPWVALVLALAIGSPSLVGQVRLDWPLIGQLQDLNAVQLSRVTIPSFLLDQLLFGPATLLAMAGVTALLFAPSWVEGRLMGLTALLAFLAVMLLSGKSYYVGPVYPVLAGAGGVVFERWQGTVGRIGRGGFGIAAAAYGLFSLPLGVPVLPPATLSRYVHAAGLDDVVLRTNWGGRERLPQDFADMLGWKELVDTVARVWTDLPEADRSRTVLISDNYGRAGAIDFYGPVLGLPPAICASGSYWFFGPGEKPGEVAIVVGDEREDLERFFEEVTPAARFTHEWRVSYERDVTIWVARKPKTTLQRAWPSFSGNN